MQQIRNSKLFTKCLFHPFKHGLAGFHSSRMLSKPDYGPPEVFRSYFLNGMKVAATKVEGLPIVACTVMFQVGSRNEVDDQIGASHFIRVASSTSSDAHTAFLKARFLVQRGGMITCRSDRQTISYTLNCPMSIFTELIPYFAEGTVKCMYFDHELDEVRKTVRNDLAMRPPEQHVLDLVQRACFRGPLSNSIYCEEERLGAINADVLNKFISNNYKTTVCSIGACGVPYEDILKVAAIIDCGNVQRPGPAYCISPSFPRGGYEVYDTGKSDYTFIALALPAPSGTCSMTECNAHATLAAACGPSKSTTPWAFVNDQTPNPPLSYLCEDIPQTTMRAFNISYMQAGCFGIIIKTKSHYAECATHRASKFLANLGGLGESEIAIGKSRLKIGLMLADESAVAVSENLALQAASDATLDNSSSHCACIDALSSSMITSCGTGLASRLAAGKLAVAVVGDVAAVPDQRELLCG